MPRSLDRAISSLSSKYKKSHTIILVKCNFPHFIENNPISFPKPCQNKMVVFVMASFKITVQPRTVFTILVLNSVLLVPYLSFYLNYLILHIKLGAFMNFSGILKSSIMKGSRHHSLVIHNEKSKQSPGYLSHDMLFLT